MTNEQIGKLRMVLSDKAREYFSGKISIEDALRCIMESRILVMDILGRMEHSRLPYVQPLIEQLRVFDELVRSKEDFRKL